MSGRDAQRILEQAASDFAAGNFAEAAAGFKAVIDLHPDVGELYVNLGAALRADGQLAEAEETYRSAIDKSPKSALAWFNLANLLRDLGRRDEALAAYRKADALQPGTAEILNNLGVQLYDMGNVDEALRHYDAALAVKPDFADALTNRGNALQRLGRMEDAAQAIDAALQANPDHPVYRLNKASYLAAAGYHADALSWADRAIAADPDYVEARLKKASLLIQTGDLAAGFRDYEVRWDIPGWHALPEKLPMPAWQGDDISGKTLLLWNEQGYGDALMYARYIPVLQQRGARVALMCEPPLTGLFRESFDDTVAVHALDGPLPEADVHASLMSLPFLMGTVMETIPATVPYLRARPADVQRWQDDVADIAGGRPTAGIVWAGNPGQAHDYSRSIAPDMLSPLLARDDVCFFNLLVGPRGNTLGHDRAADVRDRLTDFAATAALMQALDLVISVDSAPAHLAGALGRPLWVLLAFDPDSRYFLGRDDSPWYPSATLLRQPAPGDWASVIADANTRLDSFTSAKAKR
ncbi:MAG: tetratricopeptide repeat protein [Rhodospirillales bacterium]|nr:tetratricopeptide repeat protein [Rhodospirillales bacterium]MBO6787378.1 tetratricopeptide repeat protein [Rhodospirillales bacterium]